VLKLMCAAMTHFVLSFDGYLTRNKDCGIVGTNDLWSAA